MLLFFAYITTENFEAGSFLPLRSARSNKAQPLLTLN